MPRIHAPDLAYKFESILRSRLRGKRNLPAWLSDTIPLLIDAVPDEAYDRKEPADAGVLFFQASVTAESALELQNDIVSAHLSLKKGARIMLNLTTEGGETMAALAILGTIHDIRRQGRAVDIIVRGAAFSSGSIILQAATRRIIEPDAAVMIHPPHWGMPEGTTLHQYEDDIAYGRRLYSQIATIYARRGKRTPKEFEALMERRDTYLTARESKSLGLVDDVLAVPV